MRKKISELKFSIKKDVKKVETAVLRSQVYIARQKKEVSHERKKGNVLKAIILKDHKLWG